MWNRSYGFTEYNGHASRRKRGGRWEHLQWRRSGRGWPHAVSRGCPAAIGVEGRSAAGTVASGGRGHGGDEGKDGEGCCRWLVGRSSSRRQWGRRRRRRGRERHRASGHEREEGIKLGGPCVHNPSHAPLRWMLDTWQKKLIMRPPKDVPPLSTGDRNYLPVRVLLSDSNRSSDLFYIHVSYIGVGAHWLHRGRGVHPIFFREEGIFSRERGAGCLI